jgi:hypothetical protein
MREINKTKSHSVFEFIFHHHHQHRRHRHLYSAHLEACMPLSAHYTGSVVMHASTLSRLSALCQGMSVQRRYTIFLIAPNRDT